MSELPSVGYWLESRMEYPGGTFSEWCPCGATTLLSLTGVLQLVKRYRKFANAFTQFRIRATDSARANQTH